MRCRQRQLEQRVNNRQNAHGLYPFLGFVSAGAAAAASGAGACAGAGVLAGEAAAGLATWVRLGVGAVTDGAEAESSVGRTRLGVAKAKGTGFVAEAAAARRRSVSFSSCLSKFS
jgi:hypothetical protein